eukprot:TRINITY_DN14817_c0_g2_i1.p2 TRINITY_DN14817_c0_g2~~TRINITY_DN14817_c0_g2_i1.p2  ORF type:complete len:124 (-),score=28.00 TRINITY_DN14817_c0_g2_i1:277-648(-)
MDSSAFNYSYKQEQFCQWVPMQRSEEPFIHHMQSLDLSSVKAKFLSAKLQGCCERFGVQFPNIDEMDLYRHTLPATKPTSAPKRNRSCEWKDGKADKPRRASVSGGSSDESWVIEEGCNWDVD